MTDDIPFDKNLDLVPDVADEPIPSVRRIMANNPGPFTFKGTVSYIIGRGRVAIVDPGPNDAAHIGALLDTVRKALTGQRGRCKLVSSIRSMPAPTEIFGPM